MSKILSIVPYKFLPALNGGHWGVIIVEKILSQYNEVHTLSINSNISTKSTPFQTHFSLSSSKFRYLPFSQYRTALKLAKEIKPDFIFCHHHYMYPMAAKLASKLKIPIYIRCHNIESERFRTNGKWWWKGMFLFEKLAYRKASHLFFVTEEDKAWAIENYFISVQKATVMPFGIDFNAVPQPTLESKQVVANQYQLKADYPWFFFMGQLDYGPNEEAVRFLIHDILPLLKRKIPHFHLLICGKNLSENLQHEIKTIADNNDITYLGFVPKIEDILSSCDIMLNPVISGGGVKTKVVESLAWNKTVVSSYSGAIGIEQSVCGNKLLIAPDDKWEEFVDLILKGMEDEESNIPASFFDHYYAKNIADRIQQFFN